MYNVRGQPADQGKISDVGAHLPVQGLNVAFSRKTWEEKFGTSQISFLSKKGAGRGPRNWGG